MSLTYTHVKDIALLSKAARLQLLKDARANMEMAIREMEGRKGFVDLLRSRDLAREAIHSLRELVSDYETEFWKFEYEANLAKPLAGAA